MGDHLKKNNYAVYGSKNRGSSKRSSYGSDADERALRLAEYIVAEKATVRAAAKAFSVSKSTVHKDITARLKEINPVMFRKVDAVLQKNKAERHLRGGEASKEKYLKSHKV